MTLLDPAVPDAPSDASAEALAQRLLRSAARQSYDPEVDLDWDAPPVPGLWWMQPERMSLYGTPLWERLSEEQRITLSAHEPREHRQRRHLVRDRAHADPAARRLRRRPALGADPVRADRGRRRDPAHGDVRPRHRGDGRAGVRAPGDVATAGQSLGPLALRGASAYAGILIGEEPVDRWQREPDARRADPAAGPDGRADPRHRGGPSRHLRPRRAREVGARAGPRPACAGTRP
ncbi:diiron oxygenase [Nocardioides convexus]|uniref:diiron oxygenase n=1 Tax=Nocardioides convexus TaxID=2712224 RepID=UPI0024183382|nr:diiron oxygenase [Nocardioides convexus]